jgi:hypothetical protein
VLAQKGKGAGVFSALFPLRIRSKEARLTPNTLTTALRCICKLLTSLWLSSVNLPLDDNHSGTFENNLASPLGNRK